MKKGQLSVIAFILGTLLAEMGYAWDTWQFYAVFAVMLAYSHVAGKPVRA